jgi:hypothetical protein
VLSFGTTALAAALTIAGLDAYDITSTTDFYFQKVKQGGTRDSNAAIKMTLALGMLLPKSIEGSQGKDPAKVMYDLYPISSDGETAPITIATGQTLPTINRVSQLYTIGPVRINAGSLSAVQSIKWDLGMKEEHKSSDGSAYMTYCGLNDREPKCAINGLELTDLDTFTLEGVALTSFSTYFRQFKEGSTRFANSSAVHIKMSGTNGMLLPRGARGRNRDALAGEWNILPSLPDIGSECLSISTASAIT